MVQKVTNQNLNCTSKRRKKSSTFSVFDKWEQLGKPHSEPWIYEILCFQKKCKGMISLLFRNTLFVNFIHWHVAPTAFIKLSFFYCEYNLHIIAFQWRWLSYLALARCYLYNYLDWYGQDLKHIMIYYSLVCVLIILW